MALYKLLEKSFINGQTLEAGIIIEYKGKPGANLELVDKETKEPQSVDDSSNDDDIGSLRDQYFELFNEHPNGNMGAKKLKEKIAEKRKELGV